MKILTQVTGTQMETGPNSVEMWSLSPMTANFWVSQMALVVKNPLANAGDMCSIPGLGISPGEGSDNLL